MDELKEEYMREAIKEAEKSCGHRGSADRSGDRLEG